MRNGAGLYVRGWVHVSAQSLYFNQVATIYRNSMYCMFLFASAHLMVYCRAQLRLQWLMSCQALVRWVAYGALASIFVRGPILNHSMHQLRCDIGTYVLLFFTAGYRLVLLLLAAAVCC